MPRKPASVVPSGFLAVTVKPPATPAVMVAGKPLTAGVTTRVVPSASVHNSRPCTPSSAEKNSVPLTFVRVRGYEQAAAGVDVRDHRRAGGGAVAPPQLPAVRAVAAVKNSVPPTFVR